MKSPAPACQNCREAMRLDAAGALPADQRSALEPHLAGCADCRNHARALRATTEALRQLAARPVEPGPGFHARWTSAVKQAEPASPLGDTVAELVAWGRQWIRQNRRVLAALAPVWILIFVFRFSAPDVGKPAPTTVARSPVEVMLAIGGKENTQIAFDRSPPRQNPPAAAPRSDRAPGPEAHTSISNLKSQISNPRTGGHRGEARSSETALLS